jgi:hypothetical protein
VWPTTEHDRRHDDTTGVGKVNVSEGERTRRNVGDQGAGRRYNPTGAGRLCVEYRARPQCAARSATEPPLRRRATNGTYTPVSARTSLPGRGDVLVAYRPSAGSVVYRGDGTGVDATDTATSRRTSSWLPPSGV